MDSKEDILSALDEFNHQSADKVSPLLERYLNRIAATGETLFAWPKLRPLFLHKLDSVMKEFFERVPTDDLPTCPNVENVKFEEIRQRLVLTINEFNGAPFTIQRLCELITNPQKHYKRTDKFMRGIEKNLLVVSTVDPHGNKIVNETSKVLVNGLDANGYETGKVSPDTPERSFFPPPAPCSSPNTNGTGIHAANDASTSSSSSPSSSWFASSSVVDTPCPWGGGPAATGMVDSSCAHEEPSVSLATPPTPSEDGPSSRSASESVPIEPPPPAPKGTDMSESSSESSGSSSSEHSNTPPLGDIDKDSEDSNESAKTSESSSSDSSLNEAEAEQPPQPEHSTPIETTTDVAAAEMPLEPVAVDPVTTSIPEEGTLTEGVAATEQEETKITVDEIREGTKRSITQDHTETLKKRQRIDNEGDVSQSSQVESSSELQPKDSTTTTITTTTTTTTSPPPDSDVDQPAAPAADSQSQDEPERSDAMDDDLAQREAQPAEVQDGRDSQDSLGFDTPVGSDSEAAPAEESVNLCSSKPEEEAATSSTTSDSESPDSGSKSDLAESAREVVTGEAAPCEVSASDQTVNSLPDQTVEDSGSAAIPHEAQVLPEEPAVSSASWDPQVTEQEGSNHTESTKIPTDETMPEPESTSQSEDSTQISQSEDICQSSLQTDVSMDVN